MNVCDSYCHGCMYYQNNDHSCSYIFVEDHSRGCPPGHGCTRRKAVHGRKRKMTILLKENLAKKRSKNGNSEKEWRLSQEENNRRMELYKAGHSDAEIGLALGKTKASIARWRRNRKLPANFDNCHRKIDHSK